MKAIDLFAGCGGMSSGFQQAGYEITKAVEFDEVIAGTYRSNFPNVQLDTRDIKYVDEDGYFIPGEADVIIGGPPCQGFSMAGARIRQGFIGDPRNYLFRHYYSIVRTVLPEAFVMENVKGMLSMHNGDIIAEIIASFEDIDAFDGRPYKVYPRIIDASNYGVPQKRERLILIGIRRNGVDFDALWEQTKTSIIEEHPSFFDRVNVRDAIGNLPDATYDGIIDNPEPITDYQRSLHCNNAFLTNHSPSRHSTKAIERMAKIAPGANYTSLDEDIKSVHSGSYGRLCWDEPASTITTRFDTPAGGRFIHPQKNRTLTHREAARIQSFRDDFVFEGDRRSISRQIGNAVPPKIAFFVGELVKQIVEC